MHVSFDKDTFEDIDVPLSKEWLETNGTGGYASSTICHCHTRKYHGLLNLVLPAHNNKFLLLSKIEAALKFEQVTFELATNQYPNAVHPQGYNFIRRFEALPTPTTVWSIPSAGIEFEESLLMPRGHESIVIRYRLRKAPSSLTLRLHPLLAYREVHGLAKQNPFANGAITQASETSFTTRMYESMPELNFCSDSPFRFSSSPFWINNLEFSEEKARGHEFHEDLFCPGAIELELKPDGEFFLLVGTSPVSDISLVWNDEISRREALRIKYEDASDPIWPLKVSAEAYLIRNARNQSSIVAGYPWFNEWGRDTMIAMSGLTLFCGRKQEALDILKTFASYEKNGLLPNMLPLKPDETPAWNSIDASLLFFRAVQEYLAHTDDLVVVSGWFKQTMRNILHAFIENRVPIASLHDNGLLWAGDANTNLTWMDACFEGKPVTPRFGYAVEINALWYNALCFYLDLCEKLGEPLPSLLVDARNTFELSFAEVFWDEENKCLADYVNENGPDFSIRPNQIIATALPFSPLTRAQAKYIVRRVRDELLTPYGLRTLSPKDSRYKPFYRGSLRERDEAYHQGTVWPWLLGPFVEAFLGVADDPVKAATYFEHYLKELYTTHLKTHGLLQISEIFDASSPHKPNGCIAQAWSVGEVIRAMELVREVKNPSSQRRFIK
jgi:predicted glycogen debranching enzyme